MILHVGMNLATSFLATTTPRRTTPVEASTLRGSAPAPFDLILSSGFLCFSSHAGFATALEERSLAADAVVGTSSGALAGAMIAAGYSAHELTRELSRQRPLALVRPDLPWRGLFSTDKLIARLRDVSFATELEISPTSAVLCPFLTLASAWQLLPATFEELDRPLGVGVYTIKDGKRKSLLLTSGDLPSAVAASCAVPRIFSRVHIGSEWYADGGAVDRTGVAAWRKWRPGKHAMVHLVSDYPTPDLGVRDGLTDYDLDELMVVRTPRAKASFISLGNFAGELEAAKMQTLNQLDALMRL